MHRKFKEEQIKLISLHSEIININILFLFSHAHKNTQRCYVYAEREGGRERIILDSERPALQTIHFLTLYYEHFTTLKNTYTYIFF